MKMEWDVTANKNYIKVKDIYNVTAVYSNQTTKYNKTAINVGIYTSLYNFSSFICRFKVLF